MKSKSDMGCRPASGASKKKPGLRRVSGKPPYGRGGPFMPRPQGLSPVGKGHAACGLSEVFAAGAAGAAFFAGAFLAAGFLAAGFLAAGFLAAAFFAGAFFAGAFLAAAFLA